VAWERCGRSDYRVFFLVVVPPLLRFSSSALKMAPFPKFRCAVSCLSKPNDRNRFCRLLLQSPLCPGDLSGRFLREARLELATFCVVNIIGQRSLRSCIFSYPFHAGVAQTQTLFSPYFNPPSHSKPPGEREVSHINATPEWGAGRYISLQKIIEYLRSVPELLSAPFWCLP